MRRILTRTPAESRVGMRRELPSPTFITMAVMPVVTAWPCTLLYSKEPNKEFVESDLSWIA